MMGVSVMLFMYLIKKKQKLVESTSSLQNLSTRAEYKMIANITV